MVLFVLLVVVWIEMDVGLVMVELLVGVVSDILGVMFVGVSVSV